MNIQESNYYKEYSKVITKDTKQYTKQSAGKKPKPIPLCEPQFKPKQCTPNEIKRIFRIDDIYKPEEHTAKIHQKAKKGSRLYVNTIGSQPNGKW
jgi:hypothetical protein